MKRNVLQASPRKLTGKKVKALRREGKLPAIIYGGDIENTPIVVDTKAARQLLADIGANTLVTIQVDEEEHLGLVREVQKSVIKRNLLHVDFQAVSLTEMISTTVPVVTEGEAPAISDYTAMLVTELAEIDIEAQAQHLPDVIRVDITGLKEIGDSILVKDLDISDEVTILNDPDEVVVLISVLTLMELEVEEEEEVGVLEELEDLEAEEVDAADVEVITEAEDEVEEY
ncbi:MAG: General stress protein CTC [Chloroflexi bacterium]|nr:General stress protein CTC [Chloroflexota bacterium]